MNLDRALDLLKSEGLLNESVDLDTLSDRMNGLADYDLNVMDFSEDRLMIAEEYPKKYTHDRKYIWAILEDGKLMLNVPSEVEEIDTKGLPTIRFYMSKIDVSNLEEWKFNELFGYINEFRKRLREYDEFIAKMKRSTEIFIKAFKKFE